MGKLCTRVGTVDRLGAEGLHLADGSYISADIVIPCIGFSRNTVLCEKLTGLSTVKTTNYMGKHLMYLADAEIDHGAFNWFFGSSVLEYGKFFTQVYLMGLEKEDELGDMLWGPEVKQGPVGQRKWSHFIDA